MKQENAPRYAAWERSERWARARAIGEEANGDDALSECTRRAVDSIQLRFRRKILSPDRLRTSTIKARGNSLSGAAVGYPGALSGFPTREAFLMGLFSRETGELDWSDIEARRVLQQAAEMIGAAAQAKGRSS